MKTIKSGLGGWAIAMTLGGLLAGCGAMREASTRDKVMREEMTNFTYAAPIEKVWSEAKAMFARKGMGISEEKADLFTTEWQINTKDRSGQKRFRMERIRFTVKGTKLDNGTKIEITRVHQFAADADGNSWGMPATRREYSTELELVRRLEPARAQEISAKAAAAGKDAREEE
jgi:hypothetical protein